MQLYGYDIDLQVVELGEATPEAIEEQIERCAGNASRTCEFGEECMMETNFGVSRSDEDYLDIMFVGENSIVIWSPRLCFPKSFFRRLFCARYLKMEIRGIRALQEVLDYYISSSRNDFEERYSTFYCRD